MKRKRNGMYNLNIKNLCKVHYVIYKINLCCHEQSLIYTETEHNKHEKRIYAEHFSSQNHYHYLHPFLL